MARRSSRQPAGQVYSTAYYTPPVTQVGVTTYKTLDEMSPEEATLWLEQLRTEILEIKADSQNYVARRAKRGIRTMTDAGYERHIISLDKTLMLIDRMLQEVKKQP